MDDRSQVVFSASDSAKTGIDIYTLKEVDITQLESNAPQKLLAFLEQLQLGFDQDKTVIRLDIPFIKGESTTRNEYELHLYPSPDVNQDGQVKIITLSHLINILDGIRTWLISPNGLPNNPDVKDTLQNQIFASSILQQQSIVTEEWLSDQPQLELFKRQVETLLQLFQKLASGEEIALGTLDTLIQTINQSSYVGTLELWNQPSTSGSSFRDLMVRFKELPIGSSLLEGPSPHVSTHNIRKAANAYAEKLRYLIGKLQSSTLFLKVVEEIKSIESPSFLFEVSDPLSPKIASEEQKILFFIETIDVVVAALLEKKPAKLGTQAPATQGSQEVAESPSTTSTSLASTPSSPGPTSAPTYAQPTSIFSEPRPLYEKNYTRYQALSVHAGFLYNHIASNLFGLYPELPAELRRLPPLVEYQLRQDIIQHLYALSPRELQQLNRYGRFALGEDLFKRLIIRDPKLFISIEQYVQAAGAAQGITISNPDPLHLTDRTALFQHEEYIRALPVSVDQLDSADAENNQNSLVATTTPDVFYQNLYQSDEAFKAGLAAFNIKGTKAIDIKHLILSYIQTTGIDANYILANRSLTELQFLFGDLALQDTQVKPFIQLVSSYWQYQLHKLQAITQHKMVPEPLLVELSAISTPEKNEIEAESLAEITWKTADSSLKEGVDPRLTVLASLTSTADLAPDSVQRQVLTQELAPLYQNNPAEVESALNQILSIQKSQRDALAAEMASHFNQNQLIAFQSAHQEAVLSDQTSDQPAPLSGIESFNTLPFAERHSFVSSLFADLNQQADAPQDLYQQVLDSSSQDFSSVPSAPGSQPGFSGRYSNLFSNLRSKASTVSKGISRLKAIGSSPAQLKEVKAAATAAASGSISTSAFSKAVGVGAKSLFGDKIGGTIEKGAMILGSAGGVISAIGTAVSSAVTFAATTLLPAIGGALAFFGPIAAAGVAAASGLLAAGTALASGTIFKPLMGGGASGAASGTSAASSPFAGMQPGSLGYGAGAAPGGSTAVATSTAATPMSIGSIATGVGLGGTAVATAVVTLTTHGAFLANLPTIGDKDISPYVVIEKVATPGTKFDTPTDITYTIRIRAKDGFKIQLTEAPTDEFSVTFSDRETDPTPRTPTDVVPTSPDHEAFKTALTTFHTDNPIITTEPITVGTYSIPFGSNPGEIDYTDANVRNIFSIKFNVLDVNGQPITDPNGNTVASTGEVICFGDCPQSQGGCWPTSGIINQLPYGHDSHGPAKFNSDAYDIGAPAGTPVYAPFEGEACEGNVDSVNYGNHVILKVSNATYSSSGGGTSTADMHLMFAHLSSISSTLENSCQTVTPGFVLGEVGSTGNSTGPHLHYEAWFGPIASVNKKEPSLLMQYVPELVKLRDPVRSCYD